MIATCYPSKEQPPPTPRQNSFQLIVSHILQENMTFNMNNCPTAKKLKNILFLIFF